MAFASKGRSDRQTEIGTRVGSRLLFLRLGGNKKVRAVAESAFLKSRRKIKSRLNVEVVKRMSTLGGNYAVPTGGTECLVTWYLQRFSFVSVAASVPVPVPVLLAIL